MITVIDSTKFEVDFLELYRNIVKSYILTKLIAYNPNDFNEIKLHNFDVLFLTPSNLVSDLYSTNFFISSLIIDGVKMKEKQDILEVPYTDITDVDSQIYFYTE